MGKISKPLIPEFIPLPCDPGIIPGDPVYLDLTGVLQKGIANDVFMGDIVGVCFFKNNEKPNECIIITTGVFPDFPNVSPILPGREYILSDSDPGEIIEVPIESILNGFLVVKLIGRGLADGGLWVDTNKRMVEG